MGIERLISRGIQRGIQSATKNVVRKATSVAAKNVTKKVTLTATQKTAAAIAAKAGIITATTIGATAIGNKIQENESNKLEKEITANLQDHEDGKCELMTEEDLVKKSRKAQTKANIASGSVVGLGSVASSLVDIGLKMI